MWVDQRIYAIKDRVKQENAGAHAEKLKTKAFGVLSRLIMRPREEDIEVTYIEKRYEPFWHIKCEMRVEYNRGREYRIKVDDTVKKVRIDPLEYDVDGRKELKLNATEYCVEKLKKEVFIEASSGKKRDYRKYLEHEKREILETEELREGNTIVMPAKIKASYLTRDLLSDMMKPLKAEEITLEELTISKLHLYFKPIYAFEYLWKPKNKKTILEFDAATLEVNAGGRAIKQKMGEILSEADLFEVGSDAVDMFVPGGGIALRIAQKALKKH
jgi:hypothetical protein